MRKFILLGLACGLALVSFSQREDSLLLRRIADEVLINGKAYDNLRVLTKTIGARLAGSAGMVKAESWGLKTMKASGADKAWLQECMVPHWVRGGKDQAAIMNGDRSTPLEVIALGNSLGTGGKYLNADVIEVTSFDDLESKKDKIKGKIVFYNYPFNPRFIRTFQAYSDAVQYRVNGASRAAKYGAIAVIVRSMSHGVNNIPHTGAMRYDSAYAKIPALAIGLQDADKLSQQLKKFPVTIGLRNNAQFLPDTIGHNVIGELRGSEFPDEIITIGGHLDSWDNCEGAHDDGTGVTQTMEVLRALKAVGYHPKRTIRFVLFANEENGGRGGAKYAGEAKEKNEKHIFAIETDAGGFTPRSLGFTCSDEQYKKVLTWLPLVAPYGANEFVRGGGGSDIGPLNRELGTPVSSMNPDSQRYFDIHHARNDVFENVNKRELELGAINIAAIVYLVDKYGL